MFWLLAQVECVDQDRLLLVGDRQCSYELAVGQQLLQAAVVQHVAEPFFRVVGVERDVAGPGFEDGQQQDGHVG